jgi:hypothetical protein
MPKQREIARMGGAAVSENREHNGADRPQRRRGERGSTGRQPQPGRTIGEGGSAKAGSQASARKGGDASLASRASGNSASGGGGNSGVSKPGKWRNGPRRQLTEAAHQREGRASRGLFCSEVATRQRRT